MKTVKIIWNTLTWIIVIIAVLLAIALVGIRVVNIEPYIVLSGSMEPEYKAGSVIYLKSIDPESGVIQVGDPITYKVEGIEEACTHRVIAIEQNTDPKQQHMGKYIFRTKGDANETADGAVVYSKNVIGLPVFHIPYLGYLANFIKQPAGRMMVISAVCIVLLFMILPSFFVVEEKEKEEKEEKSQDKVESESGDLLDEIRSPQEDDQPQDGAEQQEDQVSD